MTAPLILWFRRDLRLDDLPMLAAACATGRPLIPVFILDPETAALGAAPKWRLGQGLEVFGQSLAAAGSRLILRRGPAAETLLALVAETGAAGVFWSRLYDPVARARDTGVKAALRDRGLLAQSHPGHLLHEPWTVQTGQGGFYRVYTPYWRAVRGRDVPAPVAAPSRLPAPDVWPASESLPDWALGAGMNRGAAVLARHARVGAAAALARMDAFLSGPVTDYDRARDLPAVAGTSRLSENLTLGEIGIRRLWHAALAGFERGLPGTETFLKELVWREFSYHLIHHTPQIATRNWKPEWDAFPWQGEGPLSDAWRRGMTGEPFVDAALREMYVTCTPGAG